MKTTPEYKKTMVKFKMKKGTQNFTEVYNIMENPEGMFFFY